MLTHEKVIPGQARTIGSKVDLLASCLLARAPEPLRAEASEFYDLAIEFFLLAQRVELRALDLMQKLDDPQWLRDKQRLFNHDQKRELWFAAGGRCSICRILLGSDWHADHVVPWSKGGPTEVSNGQALCPTCNSRKSARLLDDEE